MNNAASILLVSLLTSAAASGPGACEGPAGKQAAEKQGRHTVAQEPPVGAQEPANAPLYRAVVRHLRDSRGEQAMIAILDDGESANAEAASVTGLPLRSSEWIEPCQDDGCAPAGTDPVLLSFSTPTPESPETPTPRLLVRQTTRTKLGTSIQILLYIFEPTGPDTDPREYRVEEVRTIAMTKGP